MTAVLDIQPTILRSDEGGATTTVEPVRNTLVEILACGAADRGDENDQAGGDVHQVVPSSVGDVLDPTTSLRSSSTRSTRTC